jgi:hypothetical protein
MASHSYIISIVRPVHNKSIVPSTPHKVFLPPPGNVPPGPSTRTRLADTTSARRASYNASARRASYNASASYATSSVGSGGQALQRLKDVEEPVPTAEGLAVAGAAHVAIGLVARPLAGDVSAAPALVSLLHTREFVPRAVAAVFAFWDRQEWVSAGWAHHLLEEGHPGRLDVTTLVVPSGGRWNRGGGSAGFCNGGGSCGG